MSCRPAHPEDSHSGPFTWSRAPPLVAREEIGEGRVGGVVHLEPSRVRDLPHDHGDRLEPSAVLAGGLEADPPCFGGDVVGGLHVPRGARLTALHRVVGQDGETGLEVGGGDGGGRGEGRGTGRDGGRRSAERRQREGEEAGQGDQEPRGVEKHEGSGGGADG